MSFRRAGFAGLVFMALGASAAAQTPFTLLVTQQGQSAITLQSGGEIPMTAAIGGTETVQVLATYTGAGQATISQQPSVLGSTAFTARISGTLPATLSQGGNVTMTITFSPATAALSTAQVSLPYVEALSATTSNNGAITIALQGTAPSFALSYTLQANQNVVPLQSGGTIPFPGTLVGATSQAALNVINNGSGPGTVTGISITPGAFTLQQVPLLPSNVAAGQTLPVVVLYSPTAAAASSGQITITFVGGSTLTVNLSANGIAPSFTYQLLTTTPPTAVAPGGTIPFPGTNVGQTSSVTFRVLNSGSAGGTITSISLTPAVFQFATPVTVPQTLAPSGSLTVTLNFTPTQPGAVTGTLIVNGDSFALSGTGLGSQLVYSYLTNGTSIQLGATNPSVIFSPVMVTQSEQLVFDVKNNGTLPATISNIGVTPAGGPYTVSGVPALPVTLAPNGDFQLTITFTPTTVAYSNGTLMLDTTAISLVGSGTQPPALPSYTITGPNGNTAPMTQPSVSLSLASGYPVAISGTLALSVSGSLPADPAVQFATGVKTIPFTIPANQTSAMFGALGTEVGIQTGTVASTVTLTPSFATQAGNVPLTPPTAPSLEFAVAPAAPQLIAVAVTAPTPTSISIQVTGFVTTRTLTSAVVQLTAAAGFSLPTSKFTVDLSQLATLWFQSTASQAFGGEFTVTIPFTFQGLAANQTLNPIASVSVAVSNDVGTSSIQTNVQ